MPNVVCSDNKSSEMGLVMTVDNKLTFPIIKSVRLQNFSLYTLEPNIEIDISSGVFVLAGANGIGKSTFLAAVNFGLTGIVPAPEREFSSVNEYFKSGADFSKDFFEGRIQERDRDEASIAITFELNEKLYMFERGIFEATQLRSFSIVDMLNDHVLLATDKIKPESRNLLFQQHLVAETGVNSFEQYVFLQHFVLTFDEGRHLLLWDDRVLTTAINLVIGESVERADQLEHLRREMERADSRARNKTFAAGNVKNVWMIFSIP